MRHHSTYDLCIDLADMAPAIVSSGTEPRGHVVVVSNILDCGNVNGVTERFEGRFCTDAEIVDMVQQCDLHLDPVEYWDTMDFAVLDLTREQELAALAHMYQFVRDEYAKAETIEIGEQMVDVELPAGSVLPDLTRYQ